MKIIFLSLFSFLPFYTLSGQFMLMLLFLLVRFTMIPNQWRAASDWMYVDARNKYWLDIPRAGLCCTFNKSHLSVSHYVGKWIISCGLWLLLLFSIYTCDVDTWSRHRCGRYSLITSSNALCYNSVMLYVACVQTRCDYIFALFWSDGKADNYISTDRWPFSLCTDFQTFCILMIYFKKKILCLARAEKSCTISALKM